MKKIFTITGAALLIIVIIFLWRREVVINGIVDSVDPIFSWVIENDLKTKSKIFGNGKSLYVSDLVDRKENRRSVIGKNINHLFILIAITEEEQNRIIFSNASVHNGLNNYAKFAFSNAEYHALSEYEKILLIVSLADTSRPIESYSKRANELLKIYSSRKT